ncbi:MAG: hypothetical protein HC822_27415 [Oscillochloris sp.]|nr:hypothetical protein [Oscillochloris sp.]
MAFSPALLISLAVTTVLGLIGGLAFRGGNDMEAWNLFIAMFLWTLISAAGTIIGRFSIERVHRGDWQHGLRLASVQSFPLMICFSGIAALCGAPIVGSTIFILFGSTLIVALTVCILGVLTSPFKRY